MVDGSASRAQSTVASKIIVFLWLGFVVAFTILHVTLQGNFATTKELPVILIPSIPWLLQRGSWVDFVRLGCGG